MWKEIDAAYRQGDLKSTQPKVTEALRLARAANRTPLVVRGLFYEGMIRMTTADETDDINPVFENFRREIASAEGINQTLFQVYYARLLGMYRDENRWKIVSRTDVENQETEDIRFWTDNTFTRKIREIYQQVLAQKTLLLATESASRKEIFLIKTGDTLSIELMPTLYDAFTHYFVEFLKQQNEPVDAYLQELARINLEKGAYPAYLYNRTLLCEDHTEKLEKLALEYPETWFTGEIYKKLAALYYNKSEKAAYERVFEIEEQVKKQFPDSDAATVVSNFARAIRASAISVEMEKYIPENTNTPIRISHRNLNRVYVRVLDYNIGLKDLYFAQPGIELNSGLKDAEERYYAFLEKYTVTQEYPIDLGTFDDYGTHSSLFKLNPLPEGRYIVLVSEDPAFKYPKDHSLWFSELNVSKLAVEYDGTFRVTERLSGKPVSGKKIQIYRTDRNNQTFTLVKTLTTNSLGQVEYAGERQFFYRLANGPVFYGQNLYHYGIPAEDKERETMQVKIFSDRAIYRPGQTVYFKGIVTYSYRKEVRVLPRREVTFRLHDANGREIQSLSLKTNDFGSVNGEFVLPASGLTGSFSIQASLPGQHYILVEEYKRPRFEVEIEKPQLTYQLNNTVEVYGKAEAFSGANIDHARVEYRVYRQAIYPFRYGKRPPFEPEEQVAFGATVTGDDGRFSLRFRAIPALEQKDTTDSRMYVYRVEAAVTDLNGETQTGSGSVKVGDKKIVLSAQIENQADVTALESLKILATNLNDQPVDAHGVIHIFQLKSPERVLRKALYTTDYQYYSKAEFIKLFPHEPYGDEADPSTWEKGKLVVMSAFDTKKNPELQLRDTRKLEEGYYLITLVAKDGAGSRQLVYLKNGKKQGSPQDLFTFTPDKKSYEPGDVAHLSLNTATNSLYVFLKIEADGKLLKEEVVRLRGKTHTLDIPIKENYRGGLWVHYTFVRFNSSERGSIRLEIPFDHKKLHITTAVTRDLLTPGAAEKWSFTVSGKDKDKVVAELLAAMYDASLDQFAPNSFDYFAYSFYNSARFRFGYTNYAFGYAAFQEINRKNSYPSPGTAYGYLPLQTYNFSFRGRQMYTLRAAQHKMSTAEESMALNDAAAPPPASAETTADLLAEVPTGGETNPGQVQTRRALQETAFFFPHLKTDKDGNVAFEFTVPESLTEWKFMAFAHTPDMKTGYYETRLKTRKDLMVVPNVPRFLREGDELRISTKIVNLSGQELQGTARLVLSDAINGAELNTAFGNLSDDPAFTAAQGASAQVAWSLRVPKNVQAVTWKIVASAGDFSDGEESVMPVVTNRMLVTETLPVSIRENQDKTFTLDKLLEDKSDTRENFRLTFEMATNPIWYAIFALPYLREYPYECSEQVFSRLFANLVSENIISGQPKIKAVFDDWNRKGQLTSKLELNQELKNILLEETPWVRDATSEEEQMKRIALLFDLNKMRQEMGAAWEKLSRQQLPSGAFPWFEGGRENEYITTHIVAGFGNLKKMQTDFRKYGIDIHEIVKNAIRYMDQQQLVYYREQQRLTKNDLDQNTGIHYLYARSFFLEEYPIPGTLDSLISIYLKNSITNTKDLSLQANAMAALVLHRFGKKDDAGKLLHGLNERSVDSDEMGKYWKSNLAGWHWYQAPVETQALLIEAYDEVLKDENAVEAMKVWLLKHRQTNRWGSTKATTKAVYALMNRGKSWIDAEKGVRVTIGGQPLNLETPTAQSGSGYVKMAWNKQEIQPAMGRIEVQKTSPGVTWGALYWQYFEELDKITPAETGIAFRKKLYLKENRAAGPVLREITGDSPVQVGALVTVRLEISIDRDMEFVHIKDMRASGFEPVNVLSGYRWKEGFGYYESTRDLATHFFADFMRKGTYVFEYDVRANTAGNFSNGITQMQNMYAPELSAHSEGVRVEIR